jgi:hypothetical protein
VGGRGFGSGISCADTAKDSMVAHKINIIFFIVFPSA